MRATQRYFIAVSSEQQEAHSKENMVGKIRSSVALYLKDVTNLGEPLLTKQVEFELGNQIQAGITAGKSLAETQLADRSHEEIEALKHQIALAQNAKEKLVRANLPLVISMARQMCSSKNLDIDSFMDLIQEGNLGLIRAAQDFDPKRNVRFANYAANWIKERIFAFLKRRSSSVRIPTHLVSKIRRYKAQSDKNSSPEEIAQQMGWTHRMTRIVIATSRLLDSLSDPHAGGSHEPIAKDPDDDRPSLRREQIEEMLGDLTPRTREIITCRFGLKDDDVVPKTLEEVGKKFGITRERVRQIEAEALKLLREKLGSLV